MTPARVAFRLALLVGLCGGLFWDVGGDKMWRSSEERCVKVVDEMVRSGDWLVPKLDGEPRLQKPPLFYWAGALSATLAGGFSLGSLRAVSGLAALALAFAVFFAGRAWGGERGADLCALVLVGCAFFWIRGRVGDAEMLLTLLVFLALAVTEWLWHSRDVRLLALISLLLGLAFLAKATAALLCFFAPVVAWLALERQLGLLVRPLVLVWLAVALAIGLSWYADILWTVPDAGQIFRSYLIAPMGVQAGTNALHLRGFFYYLRFPVQLLPAGLLLPWLVWDGWQRRFWRDDPGVRFWAVAFLAQFVGWTLVPSKQIHYLLPSVPMYAVAAGRALDARLAALRS